MSLIQSQGMVADPKDFMLRAVRRSLEDFQEDSLRCRPHRCLCYSESSQPQAYASWYRPGLCYIATLAALDVGPTVIHLQGERLIYRKESFTPLKDGDQMLLNRNPYSPLDEPPKALVKLLPLIFFTISQTHCTPIILPRIVEDRLSSSPGLYC